MTGPTSPQECPYVGLDPFDRAYEDFFFGRERDSRVLADHVLSRQVTVLYGPSGVGKSSVLNVGLPKELKNRRSPCIVVMLRDWRDPGAIEPDFVDALRGALPADLANKGQLHGSFARALVAQRWTKRPLLLVLDQFEEYFLYQTDRLRSPIERGVSELLARRDFDLRLLISLREDSLHLLDRLRAAIAGILDTTVQLGYLNEVDIERAICEPIKRYNEFYRANAAPIEVEDTLVNTLIRDLRESGGRSSAEETSSGASGQIELPYLQLTMTKLWDAEGGRDATKLRLDTLTKLGGVRQIAREYVDKILNALPESEQALCTDIFRYLVTGSGAKMAYPTAGLAARVNEDRKEAGDDNVQFVTTDQVEAMLRKLTRLLKPVKVRGDDAFELFHDVLAQPVLRWRRNSVANARLVEEQRRLHAEHRRVRFLTALVVTLFVITSFALLALGYAHVQAVGAREAMGRSAWTGLAIEDGLLTPGDIPGLWQVADLTGDERDGFLAPLTGRYFYRDPIARFAAWARPSLQIKILDEARPDLAIAKRFARFPRPVLRALGLRPLSDDQSRHVAVTILAAMKQPNIVSSDLLALTQALKAAGGTFAAADKEAATELILAAMNQMSYLSGPQDLAQALQALNAKLTSEQATAAIDQMLKASRASESGQFYAPSRANVVEALRTMRALPVEFTAQQTTDTVDLILAAMKEASYTADVARLSRALQAFSGRFAKKQAQAAIDIIMKTPSKYDSQEDTEEVLQALAGKFTDDQAQDVKKAVLTAVDRANSDLELRYYCLALQALPATLDGQEAQTLTGLLVDGFLKANRNMAGDEKALAEALAAVSTKVKNGQAQGAFDRVLTGLKQPGLFYVEPIVRALRALSEKLTDPEAQTVTASIVATPSQLNDPFAEHYVPPEVLKGVATRFTPGQAQDLANLILEAIEKTDTDARPILAFAEALHELPVSLTGQQKQNAIGTILVKMNNPKNSAYEIAGLARVLGALSVRLTGEQGQDAVRLILAAMTRADVTPSDLLPLAQALTALPTTLTDEHRTIAAESFFAAMKRLASGELSLYELSDLAKAFQPLPFKFTPGEGKSVADLVLGALKSSPTSASTIAQTVEALAPHFLPDEVRELLRVARARLAMVSQVDNSVYVDDNALNAWAAAIAALASNDLATIVEVLKYPTAVGKPTETLLAALRQRFPNVPELNGDLQTAAPWFEKQLGTDVVARPPQRPS